MDSFAAAATNKHCSAFICACVTLRMLSMPRLASLLRNNGMCRDAELDRCFFAACGQTWFKHTSFAHRLTTWTWTGGFPISSKVFLDYRRATAATPLISALLSLTWQLLPFVAVDWTFCRFSRNRRLRFSTSLW